MRDLVLVNLNVLHHMPLYMYGVYHMRIVIIIPHVYRKFRYPCCIRPSHVTFHRIYVNIYLHTWAHGTVFFHLHSYIVTMLTVYGFKYLQTEVGWLQVTYY